MASSSAVLNAVAFSGGINDGSSGRPGLRSAEAAKATEGAAGAAGAAAVVAGPLPGGQRLFSGLELLGAMAERWLLDTRGDGGVNFFSLRPVRCFDHHVLGSGSSSGDSGGARGHEGTSSGGGSGGGDGGGGGGSPTLVCRAFLHLEYFRTAYSQPGAPGGGLPAPHAVALDAIEAAADALALDMTFEVR